MWDVRACRGCLAVNCKLEKLSNAVKRFFCAVTDLEIQDTDGFPKYLCTECHAQIKKSIAFRRKARRAYFVLQEIATIRKQVSYKDIETVDRIKTNLESNLGYWKTTNRSLFNVTDPDLDDAISMGQSNDKYLKTYESKSKKLCLCQVINIQPEIDKYCEKDNIKQEICEGLKQTIELEEVKLQNDFDNNSDMIVPEHLDPSNIDMNDIFKDLKENAQSQNEELEDQPLYIKKRKKIKKKIEAPNPMLDTMTITQQYQCAKALVNSTVEFQTTAEQNNNMAIRMLREPYHSSKFKCFICVKAYKTVDDLTEHAGLHYRWSKGEYKCNICRNKFREPDELLMHQTANHWYKYMCNICNISEYTLSDIVKHQSVHDKQQCSFITVDDFEEYFHLKRLPQGELYKSIEKRTGGNTAHKCHNCNIGFKTHDGFLLHMKKHDQNADVEYTEQCDVCSQWFTSMRNLTQHMEKWHNYQYECKTCSTVLYNMIQAKQHFKSHQPKNQNESQDQNNKEWKCLDCTKIFSTKIGLLAHMRLKHKRLCSEHCNVCGKSFEKAFQLYSHQLQVHKYISLNHAAIGSKKFMCKKCTVYFVNENAYQQHLVLMGHEEAKDLPFACMKCKKIFKSNDELSQHSPSCAKYPKTCSYCDSILVNALEYKLHYFREHPDLQYKPTTGSLCELCGKSVSAYALKMHMQKHSESNTFVCRYCKQECPSATQLLVHVVSVHTRRPYFCGFCRRRYKYRSECRDHILKVHTPIKPYKCRFCNEVFSEFKMFQHHSMLIHNETTETPKQIKKLNGKLYLYPNMKIDVSLMDPNLMDKIEAELCDYLNDKSKPVNDIENYIVRNQGIDLDSYVKFKKKRRRIRSRTVLNSKRQKIETETACLISNEQLQNEALETNVEFEENIENFVFDDSCIDTHGLMDVVLEDTVHIVQVDENELEIIEKNGEKYVSLNGVLYKVEDSEE